MQQQAQANPSISSSSSRGSSRSTSRPLTAVQRDRTGSAAVQLRAGRPASAAPAFVRHTAVPVVDEEDVGHRDDVEEEKEE